jgi:hypothetical protein
MVGDRALELRNLTYVFMETNHIRTELVVPAGKHRTEPSHYRIHSLTLALPSWPSPSFRAFAAVLLTRAFTHTTWLDLSRSSSSLPKFPILDLLSVT